MKIYSKTLLIPGSVIALVLVFLAGCGSAARGPETNERGNPTAASSTETTPNDNLPLNSGSGARVVSSPLKQSNKGGNVTVDVTWENPNVSADSGIRFAIEMNTHSVELDGYNLSKLAVLRNDQGVEVKPVEWGAPAGGHHRSGPLIFTKNKEGKSILSPDTRSIELTISNVAGVNERKYRWDISQ